MGKPSSKGFSKNVYPQQYHDKPAESKFDVDAVEKLLKPQIVQLVERAFRKYAKAHGVKGEQEDLEWQRFSKILNGVL